MVLVLERLDKLLFRDVLCYQYFYHLDYAYCIKNIEIVQLHKCNKNVEIVQLYKCNKNIEIAQLYKCKKI